MPDLSSERNEQKILSLLMQSPTHMRAVDLNLGYFVNKNHKFLAKIIKKFVHKYKSVPTKDTLKRYCDRAYANVENIETLERVSNALEVLKELPRSKPEEASYEFEEAEDLRIGRSLIETAEYMKERFESGEASYKNLQREIVSMLMSASSEQGVRRGLISDRKNIESRANKLISAIKGEKGDVIPFGISALDNVIGGMRKTFVTLLYSQTGGGKTRTSINVAYNAAMQGYNVMYFTLEMEFDLLASCFDSRMSWLDGRDIIFGKLNRDDLQKYKKMLKKQMRDKLNIWIVDIATGVKPAFLLEEVEIYKSYHGVDPDLIVIDYANLMEPTKKYGDRSSKYDFLFKEYHEIAKYTNSAILTSTQGSRDSAKAEINAKKNKEELERGVHQIGLSHYMATHCETVLQLRQDQSDRLQNRLWVGIDKNRYGSIGTQIPVFAIWDRNYVGDKGNLGLLIKNNKVRNYTLT